MTDELGADRLGAERQREICTAMPTLGEIEQEGGGGGDAAINIWIDCVGQGHVPRFIACSYVGIWARQFSK